MRRLVYLTAARDDLIDILRYVATEGGNPEVARSFVGRLQERCRHLAELPGTLGTARPELHPDLRSTPSHGYVIFFRYTADAVEIVNVLHASRDIQTLFNAQ